tara:strand:- start:14459 stop:15652 length:1194 start_codon:yes stop_codon:yes gene_type:complete
MNLAVFTEFFEHDRNSAGCLMTDLVRELSCKFEHIDVYSIYDHKNISRSQSWPSNVRVYNLGLDINAKSNSYLIRFFVELSISFRAFLVIISLRKLTFYDAITWYSPTIFWGPIVFILNFFKKSRKYLILRDIFPQWAIDLEIIKKYSLQTIILTFFERFQYKVADTIAIQAEGNKSYFDNLHYAKDKLVILRNWYDIKEVTSELPIEIRNQVPSNKKLLVYIGNLGIAQDQELLLDLIKEMKPLSDFYFLLIGQKDSDRENIKKKKDKFKLDNLTIINSIEQEHVNSICLMSYIGIFSLDKRHTTHNIPGKFIQYLSCGLPVYGICGSGDIVDIVSKNNFGRTYSGNNSKKALMVLEKLISDIDNNYIESKALKSYVRNNLSTQQTAKKIYDDLNK